MRIRFFTTCLLACGANHPLVLFADVSDRGFLLENLESDFQITLFASRLEGLTLGQDLSIDAQDDREIRFEFELRYPVSEHFFVFLGGSIFNLGQELKTSNIDDSVTGYEREETGIGTVWGDEVAFQFDIGRLEHVDRREWWWDEYLDSLRLRIADDEFNIMLAHGKEQRPATTDEDFIDPQHEDVVRTFANLAWHIDDHHQLSLYYLDQDDQSPVLKVNDIVEEDRIDLEDVDLRWIGVEYLGQWTGDWVGGFEWMLAYTDLRGKAIEYTFSNPVNDKVNIDSINHQVIEASATDLSLTWAPVQFDSLRLFATRSQGSGNRTPGSIESTEFRQTGLQSNGENFNYYGALYQPELSNIVINSLGIRLNRMKNLYLWMIAYQYRQDELGTRMRSVAIDMKTNGTDRDLGHELDLIGIYEIARGLQLTFTGALFTAGKAYGLRSGQQSKYLSLELEYIF